ncbi:hypothetical protein GCM10009557_70940 [Virgisporangium ochraceum]|uniref:Integral membrane protein n=1 Tax=Virgisporangium ochraceum TaxID=65505 RepID=A0A8J3ZTL5_9ACTN|nr:hypothetical protein [Virgisporangium ochraceum]GIJ70249.1 hypothetical protein Voc01_051660 [Virgisporangium ochraceum]
MTVMPETARVSLVKGTGPVKAGPAPWLRWVDLGMRILGFLVAVCLTVLTAAFEVFLSSLYWDGYRLPVSVVAAVVVNAGLIWFTVAVTGRRLPVAAIAVLWVAVMVVASSRKTEGDLLLTDTNWVGIVTMLVGSLTYAVAGYRLVLTAFRPKI